MSNLLQTDEVEATMAASMKRTSFRKGSILVVGPGPRGRGGIASVIRMHQETALWERRGMRLLATFDDRSGLHKIGIALGAYLAAPFLLLRADLVHVHLAAQTSILRKLPIVAMARIMRKPVLIHFHAPSTENLFQRTPGWALRFVFKAATRVIALSASWAEAFRAFDPHAAVVVLPNPVRSFPPVRPREEAAAVILFVGKLEARKGYSDLLVAARGVLQEFPTAEFWFAGHGECEQAEQQAEKLGISSSVRMLGWVDRASLEEIFRRVYLLALPSYAEGVPMSVIEAMSHAVPVVCTPVGGVPELIRDGENGVFVVPGDVRSLAEQIARLLREPQRATALGLAGQATVQQRCSIASVASALDSLYAEVLAETEEPNAINGTVKSRSAQPNHFHKRGFILVLWLLSSSLLLFSSTTHGASIQASANQAGCPANTEGGFQLRGLVSPAVVANTIFIDAPSLPGTASVTYFLDDQPSASTATYPFAIGQDGGYSLRSVTPGMHCLWAQASLPDGSTMQSQAVILQVLTSINDQLSPGFDVYANHSSAQLQALDTVLQQTSTPGAALSDADIAVRKSALAMYLNWGIDPSLDYANDQSPLLRSLVPQGWLPGSRKAATDPLSMLFSPDAPFYQQIPEQWPRILLPSGYIQHVQLNTVQEGDGIGFGESVAGPDSPVQPVHSQWYGVTSTHKEFPFHMSPNWTQAMPWQPGGDHHMIFVDPATETFISSYMTRFNPDTGGLSALYASSPTSLGTLGDQGGSVAAGFAELPALLQPGEATDPNQPIRHAIGGAVARTWAARVYPASAWDAGVLTSTNTCTGSGFTNTGLVPYGGVIQLDPKLDLSALGLTLPAFRVLEAMQNYGYYVEDFGCADLDIYTAISETEFDAYGGLWGYNRKGVGVQNEIERVVANNKLYVVAPLVKKQ